MMKNKRLNLKTIAVVILFGIIIGTLAFQLNNRSEEKNNINYYTNLKEIDNLVKLESKIKIIPEYADYKIIHVITTWCQCCIEELKEIAKITKNYQIIGLIWSENTEEANSWLNKYGNPYTEIGILKDTELIRLGIHKTPVTLVINSSGLIKCSVLGPLTSEKFDELITPCIK